MRVEDRVRKTVVFIEKETANRFVPLGTGFIGAVEIDSALLLVLITARHVINDYFSDNDVVSIRVNRNNGGIASLSLINAGGFRHPNKGNDLIVFPFAADISVFDYQMIPLERNELEARMAKDLWSHGVGDEVVTVGLYTSHYGVEKNIPVVRIGNIAAMPDEPVKTGSGYVTAYLIETRSIAELSGSPVFANLPPIREKAGRIWSYPVGGVILLGVMAGYHTVESAEDQIQVPQLQSTLLSEAQRQPSIDERNTGFAVVIPIERVLDILARDRFRLKRSRRWRGSWRTPLRRSDRAVSRSGATCLRWCGDRLCAAAF